MPERSSSWLPLVEAWTRDCKHPCPDWGHTCMLGMCPDSELSPQPFNYAANVKKKSLLMMKGKNGKIQVSIG